MATKTKPAEQTAKTKPVDHIQVGGVRIAIWENQGEDGPYFKVGQPELSYKDSNGEWRQARSYGARDLVNLIKAAALAHSEILKRSRKPSNEAGEDDAEA